jgi:hypothetical protein
MNLETVSLKEPAPAGEAAPAPGGTRSSLFSRALLALAVLFVVVRALPILSFPLGNDQGTYLTIGQGLLEGKQLYRDFWDNKPPGIFYLYAGIAKLFGRAMWSAAVVDILLLLLISYLFFRFTAPYLGRAGAAIAVMVHASWHGEMGAPRTNPRLRDQEGSPLLGAYHLHHSRVMMLALPHAEIFSNVLG